MVSDTTEVPFTDKYEPGCCDEATGIIIANNVYQAYNDAEKDTPLEQDLWLRYRSIDEAVAEMIEGEGEVTWWDKIPQSKWILSNSSRLLNLTTNRTSNGTLTYPEGLAGPSTAEE